MRRRSPPPPTDELDALFARLRDDLSRARMDSAFPARVERAIRARRRVLAPGWGALAAAVLLALGAALLKSDRPGPPVHALGPGRPPPAAPPLPPPEPGAPEPGTDEDT